MIIELQPSEVKLTAKGIGLKHQGSSYPDGTVWLPKSMVITSITDKNKIKIYIPDWIAERHGVSNKKSKRYYGG